MIKRVDHIAIVVHDIEEASRFYTEHLGLCIERIEEVPSQKVRVAFIPVGETRIELVEPMSEDSPISGFLQKKGSGLHHICLETSDIEETLTKLNTQGVRMIDTTSRPGAHDSRIAFVHPKANSGVLTELAEYPHSTKQEEQTKMAQSNDPTAPLSLSNRADFRTFFEESCKPESEWKIGLEYEIGGIHSDLSPMVFFGEQDIEGMFAAFRAKYNVDCTAMEDGYCFGMKVPYGELSLEPGGQMEFASKPNRSLHDLNDQVQQYIQDLQEFGKDKDLGFYTAGVNPFHAQSAMPWSHKSRYKTMRAYMEKTGTLGHRMMQQTMSVQFNIDFANEQDAVLKYEAARALQPTLLFLSSNSQIYEGQALETPMRGEIWLNTDPDRCGLPPSIENFDDYIEYALDVPMYLIVRDGEMLSIANGLTFRQYLEEGFEGHTAQLRDWPQHLSTLFPEVRFKKNALELRMFDGNQPAFSIALAALTKGIFYNKTNSKAVLEKTWSADWTSAEALLQLAQTGLTEEEQAYLAPLAESIEQQVTPGEAALQALKEANGDLHALFQHLQLRI